jgi:beta-mannosidase
MFEHWKLMDFAPGEGKAQGVFAAGFDDREWVDVDAPGDVHRAYLAAGKIPDPFYDRNEDQVAWMEQREFWYRTTFPATGGAPMADERVLLTFHGLDTYAIIYLNGKLLGRSQNMFREAVFDVSHKLEWGRTNTLAVRFDPPLSKVDPKDPFKTTWGSNPERVFMRKAQFGYGWDWGPRLPTLGIWRPVELKRHRIGALLGVQFNTLRIDEKKEPVAVPLSLQKPASALVMVRVETSRFIAEQAKNANSGALKAEIRLSIPGEKKPVLEETLALDPAENLQEVVGYFNIPNPRLWWTHDLGEPFLYDLKVTLRKGKDVLDGVEQQVGIRTLSLDQSPDMDEPGTRFFRFVLNGVPIFAKGSCWIPADSFVGAIPDEHYERLLTLAHDGNENMLRVWGGGIYESDTFYNLCDRLGILIWQDFMFACAMYPESNAHFVAEVESEARYQVRRLRSHPSLAVWCGNNENQWLHDMHNPEKVGEKVPGSLYYDTLLPNVVQELDGRTPYWPSSPFGGSDANSMEDGDRHNWWVWHGGQPRRFGRPVVWDQSPDGVSFRHYGEDSGRFISEFGMHAAPVAETLSRVIPEDQRYHHSPSMDHHNKDNPKNKGDALMESVTGLPGTLEEYIDYSMIAQAEGLKYGIEHFRRRKPHCSGSLVWQFNDCWPVLSWSLVDYYGFGKAGYFYTRRVYSPLLASFKQEPDGSVSLWLTNDRLEDYRGTMVVEAATFDGQTLMRQELTAEAAGNSSQAVGRWDLAELGFGTGADGKPTVQAGYLKVHTADQAFPANRFFFTAIKDLHRAPAQADVTVEAVNEHELRVDIHAPQGYVYFFHLTHPSEFTHYEDNYFDLSAGEQRTIRVWNDRAVIHPDEIGCGWR